MTPARPNKVVLAAGGTGGHMFPAEALARELLARGCEVELVTDRRGAGFGPDLGQVAIHRISAGGVAGGSPLKRLRGLLSLAVGFVQARGLLKRLGADAVVGFGGYPSVPTALAGGLGHSLARDTQESEGEESKNGREKQATHGGLPVGDECGTGEEGAPGSGREQGGSGQSQRSNSFPKFRFSSMAW